MCKSKYSVTLSRLLTISIIAFTFSACDARLRNKGTALIGDVELFGTKGPPSRRMLTLRELNSVLRSEHQYSNSSSSLKNQVAVRWWGDLVWAQFYIPGATHHTQVDLDAAPYKLNVLPPFKGTILGVHLGDSHDQVISLLQRAGYDTADPGSLDGYCVNVDKPYRFCWTEDKSRKVVKMSLNNANFIALPGSK